MAITHGSDAIVGNTEIVWKLKLRVKPEGEPEFDADVKQRYGQPDREARGSSRPRRVDGRRVRAAEEEDPRDLASRPPRRDHRASDETDSPKPPSTRRTAPVT